MTKKRLSKRAVRGLSALVLVLCTVVGAICYVEIWRPNRLLEDRIWVETASKDQIRQTCHQVIGYPVGNHHDAFLWLELNGNADSVPLLIRALKWQIPVEEGDICTTKHCLDALRSLTGHNAGNSFNQWDTWWKESGSRMPRSMFYPRKADKDLPVGER